MLVRLWLARGCVCQLAVMGNAAQVATNQAPQDHGIMVLENWQSCLERPGNSQTLLVQTLVFELLFTHCSESHLDPWTGPKNKYLQIKGLSDRLDRGVHNKHPASVPHNSSFKHFLRD